MGIQKSRTSKEVDRQEKKATAKKTTTAKKEDYKKVNSKNRDLVTVLHS